ncbi:MAG: ACP S-malonyltransferase [Rhizobiales bacterium]|nr:ACP S-malonyltransferase [Hyphomicrobiales bacterium]
MAFAFTFPGQGSQHVGMGRELAEAFTAARDVFAEIDDALSQHLSKLMWEGPESDLQLTENTQPALMAVSLAVMRALEAEADINVTRARFVAGHSLGEYSALAAAGSLTIADTARILRTRGRAMQEAVPVGEGAMAALIGIDVDAAKDITKRAEQACGGAVCAPANDNAPGQVVVSGAREAVEQAMEFAKDAGARRALLLPVSAPFHCALMEPAAQVMHETLGNAAIRSPAVALVANVTAKPVSDSDEIVDLLVEQVTAMVRWRECVLTMAQAGVDAVYEIGSGKVLSGLARRISPDLNTMSIAGPGDLETLAAALD